MENLFNWIILIILILSFIQTYVIYKINSQLLKMNNELNNKLSKINNLLDKLQNEIDKLQEQNQINTQELKDSLLKVNSDVDKVLVVLESKLNHIKQQIIDDLVQSQKRNQDELKQWLLNPLSDELKN